MDLKGLTHDDHNLPTGKVNWKGALQLWSPRSLGTKLLERLPNLPKNAETTQINFFAGPLDIPHLFPINPARPSAPHLRNIFDLQTAGGHLRHFLLGLAGGTHHSFTDRSIGMIEPDRDTSLNHTSADSSIFAMKLTSPCFMISHVHTNTTILCKRLVLRSHGLKL